MKYLDKYTLKNEIRSDSYAAKAQGRLDNFDARARSDALDALRAETCGDADVLFHPGPRVNLHTHTFFSYHAKGHSPTHFAWLAKRSGLEVAGIVDFDVLDGADEFHDAGRKLGLKTVASIESRVFVPEFADLVINSPGEPGVAYHMGAGFVTSAVNPEIDSFLRGMREAAGRRTRDLVERVNSYLRPVELDYDMEVRIRTPNGNATERHVCEAYVEKAATRFAGDELRSYWEGKLGTLPDDVDLPAGPVLQGLVRARTMKRGGAGYVQPDSDSFPRLDEMNRFVLKAGAIPTLTWLDGFSDGEQQMERYIEVAKTSGAAALNIIPDRNFTPGVDDDRLRNLYAVVELAEVHHLPVIVGTEMNSPGQKFVDDLDAKELAPLAPAFLKGAHIVYAHTVLQRHGGMGYLSPWATRHFDDVERKNEFFRAFGDRFEPGQELGLEGLRDTEGPPDVLNRLGQE